jgi:murein endopeptidase
VDAECILLPTLIAHIGISVTNGCYAIGKVAITLKAKHWQVQRHTTKVSGNKLMATILIYEYNVKSTR